MMRLQTDQPTHAERAAYLAEALAGLYDGPAEPAATPGGRRAALRRLRDFDPRDYARTRNDVVHRGVSLLPLVPLLARAVPLMQAMKNSLPASLLSEDVYAQGNCLAPWR